MERLIDKCSVPNTLLDVNLLTSFIEAKSLWAAGKTRGEPSLTNFFLTQHSIERAIRKERLTGISQPGASLLLRRDRDFSHLYINFSDREVLKSQLEQLTVETPLVVDVIQRDNSHGRLISVLEDAGFTPHRLLFRLNRQIQATKASTSGVKVQLAHHSSAAEILRFLETYFDKYSEQLPELDEIEDAISKNQILISLIDHQLAGFLYFESSGESSILRYWFISPDVRNQNVGSALIRHYLSASCPNAASQLWVVHDNYNAIDKYKHYGYTRDVLEDQIMIRK
jgi:GNAT superfamily N-acetyltransferase